MANLKGKGRAPQLGKLAGLKDKMQKDFGPRAARLGSEPVKMDVIPSGILAFDLATGIGGFPRGHATGIYGTRDIGKSVHAALAVANAQKLGLEAGWIAYETTVDERWMTKWGVNVDDLLITHPASGEAAFQMLYRMIEAEAGIVVFDSVGSILGESEIGPDGKPRQGGQAGLISWGMKNCVPLAYHTNTAVIMLNQARANMNARYAGATQQPGGYALEHLEAMIVHLKGGKNRYTMKVNGEDVEIGRDIVAHFERNKLSEGSRRKATYQMYFVDTDGEYPFGVDVASDVINTGKRTGVIQQGGAMYTLPNGHKIKGKDHILPYLLENPEVLDQIRTDVLSVLSAPTFGADLGAAD